MKLVFGKYKGEDITDVPITYLKWLEENIEDMSQVFRDEINYEIQRREGDITSLGKVCTHK